MMRSGSYAEAGEIVVAVHTSANGQRGAATIKRLYIERAHRRVWLQQANAALPPILVCKDE